MIREKNHKNIVCVRRTGSRERLHRERVQSEIVDSGCSPVDGCTQYPSPERANLMYRRFREACFCGAFLAQLEWGPASYSPKYLLLLITIAPTTYTQNERFHPTCRLTPISNIRITDFIALIMRNGYISLKPTAKVYILFFFWLQKVKCVKRFSEYINLNIRILIFVGVDSYGALYIEFMWN